MQNAGCKIVVFPSEMDKKHFNFVRKADTFILHFASYTLHFVVANNNVSFFPPFYLIFGKMATGEGQEYL